MDTNGFSLIKNAVVLANPLNFFFWIQGLDSSLICFQVSVNLMGINRHYFLERFFSICSYNVFKGLLFHIPFLETFFCVLFYILQLLTSSLSFSLCLTYFLGCRNYYVSSNFSLNVLKMSSANREKFFFLCCTLSIDWLCQDKVNNIVVIICKQECLGQIISAYMKCQIFTLFRRNTSLHKF